MCSKSFKCRAVLLAVGIASPACGGNSPVAPSEVLTATLESTYFSYHFTPGETMQVDRQEAHHVWAISQLGVVLPHKISYNKYQSRAQMGEATGHGSTNGFAETATFTVHTLWAWDNHEPVHVYSALIGRPSDFFNEGLAVAFQTDPAAGNFESRFNGQQVHAATAGYRAQGLLPPLDQMVQSSHFRAIGDSTMSYRVAGSFVRFVIDAYGLDRLKTFFRTSGQADTKALIDQRFEAAFGQSLAAAEAAWLESLPKS